MSEPDNLETDTSIERAETVESADEQSLQEATHDPGGRIEQTQEFEQAEVVEIALVEAISTVFDQQAAETPAETTDRTPEDNDGSQTSVIGQVIKGAEGQGQPMDQEKPEGKTVADIVGGIRKDPGDSGSKGKSLADIIDGVKKQTGNEAESQNSGQSETLETSGRAAAPPVDGESIETEGRTSAPPVDESDQVGTDGHVAAPPASDESSGETAAVSLSGIVVGPEINIFEAAVPTEASKASLGRIPDPEPDPVPEDRTALESSGSRVAEAPEPGPHPFPKPADDGSELMRETGDTPELRLESSSQTLGDEMAAQEVETVIDPTQIPGVEVAVSLETQSSGEIEEMPQDTEEANGEADEGNDATNYFLYEDENGKITVVDENGKPVNSPPNLVFFNGKYYAVYPGDDLPIKADGTVDDPVKLAKYEISDFKGSTTGLYLHEDDDGNVTVVDENGKPVDSPPAVVTYQGKKYLVYPGDNLINPDGTLKDPSKLVEADYYKTSTEGLYLHEDGDGNVTVVDENGKPVDSPPAVVTYQGKKYLAYPGDNPVGPDGTVKDPSKLVAAEYYKTSTDGMFLYEDGDGNVTVVDENGDPVDSPPVIITFQGKKYAVYPGENPVGQDGTVKDPSKLVELSDYESPVKDIYLHESSDGKVAVVDAEGNPVNSPPQVFEYQGKYYVSSPGENPFGADGILKDPSKLIAVENFKTEIKDMYLHEDSNGKMTVVNSDGTAINSPPNVFEYQGKYYAAYPGDDPINPDGTVKDPSKLIEIKNYKPSWWGKQAS